jgi:hypothetical protein
MVHVDKTKERDYAGVYFKNDKRKNKERSKDKSMFKMNGEEFINNPKYLGAVLIIAFFIAYILSAYAQLQSLPVFVICTISVILSSIAIVWNYTFLNSIVIGYWCIYLVTIADVFFGAGAFWIHLVNLILSTIVLFRRWRNSWPWLIFLSGFLWAMIIGTEKQVTGGASEYFYMFDWRLTLLFIGFNLFMSLIIWLGQNPRNQDKKKIGTARSNRSNTGTKIERRTVNKK